MSDHSAKRRKLAKTDPPDIKEDLCNCLVAINSDKSNASVLDDQKQNLNKVLARWIKQDRESGSNSDRVYEKLIYVLDREYSEATIGLEHFTGKDKLRTHYLLEACRKQGFCLYFAQFRYSLYGEAQIDPSYGHGVDDADYDPIIHEIKSSLKLQTIFQYDGTRIAENIDLEEEDLLETLKFTGVIPDYKEGFAYTDSDGYFSTYFYFKSCAVIVPRARRYDFLLHAKTTHVQEYVETLLREMQDDPLSLALQDELKRIYTLTIVQWTVYKWDGVLRDARVPDKELVSIGKATLGLDRPDLLEKLARGPPRSVPHRLFQEVGIGLVERDISLWQYGIELAIWSIRTVSERVKVADLLMSSYQWAGGNAATMQRMQDFERKWAMGVIERHISSFSVTAANAQALMQLSQMYGEAYTLQVILPIVKNHTSNMGFIVAFLTALFRAGETDIVRPEIVRILFGDILAAVIPDLDLHRQASRDFGPGNESLRVISPEDLANLFFQCEYLGLSHEIDKLANKIILEASHMESTIFERLLLPLVKQLAPVVERDPNNINTPRFVKTFRTMIPSYINAYVQFPPQKPTGLEHQPRDCNLHCRDCNTFDDFLKSPDEEVLYFFKLNAKRRTHLEERLRGSSCRTETIKKGRLYTFVVTKKGLEWKNAMKEWNQRCGFALEKVEEIGVERLRSLLREGWEVDCLPIFADSNLSNDDDLLGE